MREIFFVGKKNQRDSIGGGFSGVFVIDTIRRLHQLSPRCSTQQIGMRFDFTIPSARFGIDRRFRFQLC
jgi:hypothetical protein